MTEDKLVISPATILSLGRRWWPALSLIPACACDTETRATSAPQIAGTDGVFEPGQTAETAHFSMLVHGTKRCDVEPHFQPPAGIQKFGVEVTITGLSALEVPVNPFYALLTDEKGERYEATLVGCTPQLKAQRVARGRSARGWATFQVPEASRGLKFSYSPTVIGAKRQDVLFALDP